MKTKEELDVIKKEVESLNSKLSKLTDEELEQVIGGEVIKTLHSQQHGFRFVCDRNIKEIHGHQMGFVTLSENNDSGVNNNGKN